MKKVVIIDDNILIIKALCETINWENLDAQIIFTSNSTKEALEFIKKNPIDLLITDIKMPYISGLELIKQLQEANISFASIIITGFSEFEYARQALLLGASDIILKPIDNQMLISSIERIFHIFHSSMKEQPTYEKLISTPPPYNLKITPRQKIISLAIQYMQENIESKITLTMLAEQLDVSRSHLSRCFKEEYQKSFVEIYNDMRMQTAIEYLQTGQYRIFEVANKVGFDNYAYFYQCFKKYTGKNPKEYYKN